MDDRKSLIAWPWFPMRLRKRSDLGTTAWVASIQPFVRLESIDLAAFCAASDRNRPEVWAKHGQGRGGQRQGGVEMAERRHQTSGYETVAEKNPRLKGAGSGRRYSNPEIALMWRTRACPE